MLRRIVFLIAFLAVALLPAMAQLNRGTLTGTVTDQSAAAIPKAKVAVRNSETGAVYRTLSNDAGQYAVPNLPAGRYDVSFEAPQFKSLVHTGVDLGATEVLRVDATLPVGSVSESVSVTSDVPKLQGDIPEVSNSLSNRELAALPLSFDNGGRKAENFAYKISPGVSGDGWTSYINGATAFSKEALVDGASATTWDAGDITASSPSIEALQEVKVQTGGISAEFGHTQTGVFNLVMKSGENRLHGSAFGAIRNEALNANTFVNNFNGVKRSPERKQDFAGSFGGPVYIPKLYDGRNHTFFFVAYETYRQRTKGFGAPDRTVPLPEFYTGDFSRLLGANTGQLDALGRDVPRGAIYDPATFQQLPSGRWIGEMFPGNKIPVSRFSAVSQRLNSIASSRYLPSVRDAAGNVPLVNNSRFPVSQTLVWDNPVFSLKGDHIINDAHKISGSYTRVAQTRSLLAIGGPWDPSDTNGGPLSVAWGQAVTTHLGRLAHDWTISPRVLNHFTAFFNRQYGITHNLHSDVDGAKNLGIKGLSTIGYPAINWGSGPFVSLVSPGDTTYAGSADNAWGFLNTTSFFRGRHFMKAGFEIRHNFYNTFATQGGAFNFNARATAIPNETFSGNLTGYSFASYLLGIVDSAGLSDPISLGGRKFSAAAFFNDDFKVNKRLTLQLGLRWDFQPPFFEAADRLSSWNPAKTDPVSGLPGAYDFAGNCQGCTGSRYFGTRDFQAFGPRIGFAFRAAENLTLRGAYGIYYEADVFNGFNATPLGKATNVQWGGTWALSSDPVEPWRGIFNWDNGFPANRYVPPFYDVSWGNRNRPGMIDPNYGKAPYMQQWNFNVQRELAKKLIVDIGYVGSKGTRLRNGALAQLNQLAPSLLSQFGRTLNNPVRNLADAVANGIAYPFPGFTGTVASALRRYPQVQGNQTIANYGAPLGFSTYNSLQIVVNRQFGNGLTMYANYVWSKSLSNTASSLGNPGPLDYYNLGLEKAVSSQDVPHMGKVYVDYALPVGKGKAILSNSHGAWNLLLSNWSISAILNYFSGTPLTFGTYSPLTGGWNGATFRPNIAAGSLTASGFDKARFELSNLSSPGDTYLNKGIFSNPAPLTLGTAARAYAQARTFGIINEDFGLQKSHFFAEKFRLQLRAEFLNAFNRHQLGGVVTDVTNPLFGQVTSVSGNRIIQLGARLDF